MNFIFESSLKGLFTLISKGKNKLNSVIGELCLPFQLENYYK